MSLQKWLEHGWLRPHQSSRKEITDLLRIIDRDLQDAAGNISAKNHPKFLAGNS